VDLSKIKGGRQGQQRVAEAVAMESANRVLTRRALDMLKAIATGEFKPSELAKSEMISEGGPVEPMAEPAEDPAQEPAQEPVSGGEPAEAESAPADESEADTKSE